MGKRGRNCKVVASNIRSKWTWIVKAKDGPFVRHKCTCDVWLRVAQWARICHMYRIVYALASAIYSCTSVMEFNLFCIYSSNRLILLKCDLKMDKRRILEKTYSTGQDKNDDLPFSFAELVYFISRTAPSFAFFQFSKWIMPILRECRCCVDTYKYSHQLQMEQGRGKRALSSGRKRKIFDPISKKSIIWSQQKIIGKWDFINLWWWQHV